jgi:hypothetical protein
MNDLNIKDLELLDGLVVLEMKGTEVILKGGY